MRQTLLQMQNVNSSNLVNHRQNTFSNILGDGIERIENTVPR